VTRYHHIVSEKSKLEFVRALKILAEEMSSAHVGELRIKPSILDGTAQLLGGHNWHPMGTLRMGLNSSNSICDLNLKVHSRSNVYVADAGNGRIRKISPSGVVTTLAGSGDGFADGTGTAARFSSPSGVAVDGSGNVYVTDEENNRIRKISPAGEVSFLAGSGETCPNSGGFSDGTGKAASFNEPNGVAIDGSGNVYVADQGNHRIRKISPSGMVTTLAGSGIRGNTNGIGTSASFHKPTGIALDGAGNVYVAESENQAIRKLTPDRVNSSDK
jgi:sugar lactone lactonase YvrE